MQEKFLQFIAEKKLCTQSDKILLAVSGGMDSMVMLDLFLRAKFSMAVAHVNFQLRENDSELDQRLVEETCKKYSIPFFTKRFATSAYAQQHALSIQMAARALRYEWFRELLDQHKFDFIATAHHLNDSIETALLNFTRGSGLEGWDGIAAKNGKIIRPLLFAARTEIEAYANENKISWREDRSNSSDDYQRNFIRHHVVPKLKEINPSLENSFANALEKISASNELSRLGIELFRSRYESKKGDQILVSKNALVEFPHPEGLLWNLIKGYGFNFDQCKQIIQAFDGQPGKRFLSEEFEAVIDREQLIISKKKTEAGNVVIEKDQQSAQRGGQVLEMAVVDSCEFPNDTSIAFLDLSKLKFPLVWRSWKAGDAFQPLGMSSSKKISDFLIDKKISVADKESVSVIESAGEIVWVVGMRISERFKVMDETQKILRFHFFEKEVEKTPSTMDYGL